MNIPNNNFQTLRTVRDDSHGQKRPNSQALHSFHFCHPPFFWAWLKKMNYCSSLIHQKFNCNIYRDKNFDNAKSKDDLHHEVAYVQKMSDSAQYMIISTSTCFFIVRFEDKCLEVGLLTNLNLMGVGINFTQGQFH